MTGVVRWAVCSTLGERAPPVTVHPAYVRYGGAVTPWTEPIPEPLRHELLRYLGATSRDRARLIGELTERNPRMAHRGPPARRLPVLSIGSAGLNFRERVTGNQVVLRIWRPVSHTA